MIVQTSQVKEALFTGGPWRVWRR